MAHTHNWNRYGQLDSQGNTTFAEGSECDCGLLKQTVYQRGTGRTLETTYYRRDKESYSGLRAVSGNPPLMTEGDRL